MSHYRAGNGMHDQGPDTESSRRETASASSASGPYELAYDGQPSMNGGGHQYRGLTDQYPFMPPMLPHVIPQSYYGHYNQQPQQQSSSSNSFPVQQHHRLVPSSVDYHQHQAILGPGLSSGSASSSQTASPRLKTEDRDYSHEVESSFGGPYRSSPTSEKSAAKMAASSKARSTVACALCRKQKMKCEGPEKAPCRRCVAAGVKCVFESTAVAGSRSKSSVTEAWVESRLSEVERRLETLETRPDTKTFAVPPSSETLERRIAQLESQIATLALSQNGSTAQQAQLTNTTYASPHLGQDATRPSSMSHWRPQASFVPPFASSSNFSAREEAESPMERQVGLAKVLKRDATSRADGNEQSIGFKKRKTILNGDQVGLRSQGGDLVSRGLLSEDEAIVCFESYFINFEKGNGPGQADSDDHSDGAKTAQHHQQDGPSWLRTIHLPYEQTRRRSKLLWTTLVSIGARSLCHFETYHLALNEALHLCRQCLAPFSDDECCNDVDLRGIMLLAMYNSLEDLVPLGVSLSYRFGLHTALLDYEQLSQAQKSSDEGLRVISQGRTFLLAYFWTVIYSSSRGVNGGFEIPATVIQKQLEILEASEHSQQPSDRVLRIHCEECFVLKRLFDRFGPGKRTDRPTGIELCAAIDDALNELDAWARRWLGLMEIVSQWGENEELKNTIPLHHGRMSVLSWALVRFSSVDMEDKTALRRYSSMARDSATAIIRWAVESRAWVPHSMVAQYLHFVNIPSALRLLDRATRLFPDDADFVSMRLLLQRLRSQCDAQISEDCGTRAELQRAITTRKALNELDQYAFLHAEDIPLSVSNGPQEQVTEEDVQASLSSAMHELNLWGLCLLDCLIEAPQRNTGA